ncbi:MAG: S41 family peptidase [Ginsengibacter sp.]
MKTNISKLLPYVAFTILLGSFLFSCKKEKSDSGPKPPTSPVQLSDADSLKYFMYRTMQVSFVNGGRDSSYDLPTYLWYSQVPKLDPFSKTYDSAKVLLNKIKTYPINPASSKPFDKYSFLDDGTVSGEIQGGVAGDLGMEITKAYDKDKNIVIIVLYADKNSPSGKVGVSRGWQITSINGQDVSDASISANVNKIVQAVYNDAQSSIGFKKPDGTPASFTLAKAVYQINPILFDSVYSVSGKNVGYFVFNTFSNIYYKGAPTLTKQEIDRVFARFKTSAISSLIVDFRYNGGGSVNTAEYLDSLIAPTSVAGKVMYQYIYNNKLTARASEIGLEDKVLFKNGGGLQLDNVFFIGSGNTASASELTLNNLKPYMNVKLVGDTTYGKPVGFFTFTLSDYDAQGKEKFLADLYAINFETRNASNQGGYFNGLVPDALATDYVGIPWGDVKDDHLTKIFKYISTGTFGKLAPGSGSPKDRTGLIPTRTSLKPLRFNGMIDYNVSRHLQNAMGMKKKNGL